MRFPPVGKVPLPPGLSVVDGLPVLPHSLERGFNRLHALLVPKRFRHSPLPACAHEEIVPAIPTALLKAEIEALPPEQTLVRNGRFRVQYAHAAQIPWCLQELGRLREISFRAAGEGTGRASDIDLFDAHYLHLFVWDEEAQAIVGAYRLGLTDEILSRYGRRGLYTQSLFKYGARALQSMNPGIELGRSFVRSKYQRSYAPLMLLWRGIGRFVERHPRYAILFGAVSISNSYDPASRRLIVEYLKANTIEAELARYIKSRRQFTHLRARQDQSARPKDIDELSQLVARIEPDSKGVPVLLRQYLKLGGRLLGFSSDAQFSNTLDGLMRVDLRHSDLRVLERYMGVQGTSAFLDYHRLEAVSLRRAS